MALSISDTQHNDTQHNGAQHNDIQHKGLIFDTQHVTLSITTLCHYTECRILFTIMLNVVMLIVVAPSKSVHTLQDFSGLPV